ncbi:glycosyltransferase family 2 protein [Agromyces sp. H3Y2-19a]|uniref:glycosyltransferase family 2 protein n=1 Tax=Agromyces TaxID=33877 RepID=UPI0023BA0E3C|nr:glycosyltransferase family 2 protein [Agromyces chromiiresistens]MDF0514656.1 glycosyltransferase family 2 protein [Agromyces chromiiresistens]
MAVAVTGRATVSRVGRAASSIVVRCAAVFRPTHPIVSVVVPAHNTAEYIDDALDSVLAQEFRDLEVIVVDDGSTDRTYWRALRKAVGDPRIRVLRQRAAGAGPARNRGIGRARGRYLAFLDSDDVLPADSLSSLIESAERTGSQVAVGAFRRFDENDAWVPEWVGEVNARPLSGTTLESVPKLLRNNYPCGKVFRRDFWDESGLGFRSDAIYEDQPLIAQLMLAATSIDVLDTVTYDYRRRSDRSSISQRPEELVDLRQRVAAWMRTLAAFEAGRTSEAVIRGWYWTVYQTHMHWYLDNDAIADAEYWRLLRGALLHLRDREPTGVWTEVTASRRAALALLAEDRHADLLAFRDAGGYEPARYFSGPTTAGLVYDFPIDLPERSRTTEPAGVRVDHVLDTIHAADGAIIVSGRIWLHDTPADTPMNLEILMREDVDEAVEPRSTPVALIRTPDGGFRARLPIDDLEIGTFILAARGSVGPIDYAIELAEPSWVEPTSMELTAGDHRVTVRRHPNRFVPVRFDITPMYPAGTAASTA